MNLKGAQVAELLDEVVSQLDAAGEAPAGPLPDAIDRERSREPRRTQVRSLRRDEAVERFRQELESESLTIATVAAFLELLGRVIGLVRVR